MQAKKKKLKDGNNSYIAPITHPECVIDDTGKNITQLLASKWHGKKANFMGDSITYGTGTTKVYHQYLQEELGLVAARNYGISGSTIASGNNGMYDRVKTMDTDVDIIFVFGGTNDFYFGQNIGDLYYLDASNNRQINTTAVGYFYNALHVLCKNLYATFPGKQYVLMTPLHREVFGTQPTEFQPNADGEYLDQFVDAIVNIGKWYSIPVLDLYRVSGLNPNEPNNKALYFSPSDGLHPNAEGHRVIANKIKAFLETI